MNALYGRWVATAAVVVALGVLAERGGRPLVDAVSAATRPGQSVVGSVSSAYELLAKPRPVSARLTDDEVLTLVRWANNLSYGLANVASPGPASVLVVGAGAHRAFLRAVVLLCAQLFPDAEITLGLTRGTRARVQATIEDLSTQLAGDVRLRVVDLVAEPKRPLPSYKSLVRDSFQLPESIAYADVIVLAPSLVRDRDGRMQGALALLRSLASNAEGDEFVDLVSAVAPHYVFADGLRPRVGDDTRHLNHVLASHDPVAVDAVAAQLLEVTPHDVADLEVSASHALGKLAWEDIKLNGAPVPGVPQEKTPFQGPARATPAGG